MEGKQILKVALRAISRHLSCDPSPQNSDPTLSTLCHNTGMTGNQRGGERRG